MPEVAKKLKYYPPRAGARAVLDAIERANQPAKIGVGDRVRWNGAYSGTVLAVHGDSALVEEPDNWAFGRAVTWRLLLSSLTRVGSPV